MAIGWLALLQRVPWTEVISNAPKVVDGAKRLWNAVARKSSPSEVSASSPQPVTLPEFQTIAALEARASALEAAVSDLQGQMLASSELIKALADQNAQLIQRMETHRILVIRLSVATAVLAIIALLGLLMAFSRHSA